MQGVMHNRLRTRTDVSWVEVWTWSEQYMLYYIYIYIMIIYVCVCNCWSVYRSFYFQTSLFSINWWFFDQMQKHSHDEPCKYDYTVLHPASFSMRPGFFTALWLVLRMRPNAVMSCGPPCGSFIYLNSSTSGRSKSRPLGFASLRSYVMMANRTLGLFCSEKPTNFLASWSRKKTETVVVM